MILTNITEEAERTFKALGSGEYDNFALFSCFYDGEPASVIVSVTRDGDEILVTPLFLHVTAEMMPKILDHNGVAPTERYSEQLELKFNDAEREDAGEQQV